jgi:hypothetical protein
MSMNNDSQSYIRIKNVNVHLVIIEGKLNSPIVLHTQWGLILELHLFLHHLVQCNKSADVFVNWLLLLLLSDNGHHQQVDYSAISGAHVG